VITRIITVTGRVIVWVGTVFPLSTRFLDDEFRGDEGAHLRWGLIFYSSILAIVATLVSLKSH
jgi:hypothetical protein